ncbi:hypothetical protein [Halioxenophilus sp. WMMB6]|nr:hypothetical protein [Halioxenophilus sp. WMMB6]
MYIDTVVLSGIIVVVATAAVVIYATKFMVSHIREELRKNPPDAPAHK